MTTSEQGSSAMFVLNEHGHYFEINTDTVSVNKELFTGCRFFDDEKSLLEAASQVSDCTLEEVEGSTFYITQRDGKPLMFDDRCFTQSIDEPIEAYVSDFYL